VGDPREALREANGAFYRAVEELDLAAMERVWLQEPWVRCIHPGGTCSWDGEGAAVVGADLHRHALDPRHPTSIDIQVLGEVGLVGCAENITATSDGDVGVAVAQATNLFLRTAGGVVHVPPPFVAGARARDAAVQRTCSRDVECVSR
jgi:hypothetical protein